jgi:hypothetical protein
MVADGCPDRRPATNWTRTLPQTLPCSEGTAPQKKKKAAGIPAAFWIASLLETNRRTESNPQVVMGAVFEVNLVAHVCAQADWAQKAFESDPRVDCGRRVTGGYVLNGTLNPDPAF